MTCKVYTVFRMNVLSFQHQPHLSPAAHGERENQGQPFNVRKGIFDTMWTLVREKNIKEELQD